MPTNVDHVQRLVDRVRSLVPAGEDDKEYLTEIIYERMSVGNRTTPMGPMGIVGAPRSDQDVYGAALTAAENLDAPAELVGMPEGIIGLENLIWEMRPALPLTHGVFKPLEVGPWQHLDGDSVSIHAPSVCRIDLCTYDTVYRQLGTGFVVGKDQDSLTILTNRHVVDAAVNWGWPVLDSLSMTCDFARESVLGGGDLLRIEHDFAVHAKYDMALLTLRMDRFTDDSAIPDPLALATTVGNDGINLQIGVIGHPALNTAVDGEFPKNYGFGDAFGIKRFSPGLIRAKGVRDWYKATAVDVVFHDATTLGGNSGSCVLNLDSGQVVGLHFGGWPMPGKQSVNLGDQDELARLFFDNGAVPLWLLANDQIAAAMNFM